MKVEHSVVINRPAAAVFAMVGNPDNDPQWGSLIAASRQTSAGPVDVGTTYEQTATFMGGRVNAMLEVTAYEPGRLTCFKTAPPIHLLHCRRLEPMPEGTRLTFVTELDPGGRFKVAEALLRRIAQRQLEADLSALKDMLEA